MRSPVDSRYSFADDGLLSRLLGKSKRKKQ
jgi:hypothetical protein